MLKISCSNLFRYFICPAALNHEQTYVEKEKTKYSEEGITKHLEMQEAIEGTTLERSVAAEELRQEFLKIEPNFSFEDCVCEERLESKTEFNNSCDLPHWTLIGKPDLIYVSKYTKTFYIIDYKFGYVSVEPKNNPQLLGYVALCNDEYNLWGVNELGDFNVKVGIFQDGRLKLTDVDSIDLDVFEDVDLDNMIM